MTRRLTRLILVLGLLMVAVVVYQVTWAAPREVRRRQEALLRADRDVLLAACREVYANRKRYRQNPVWNDLPPGTVDRPDPADPQMPAAIRALSPQSILIEHDHVKLEFDGGFGARGYMAGVEGLGTRKLAESLWYDEGDVRP